MKRYFFVIVSAISLHSQTFLPVNIAGWDKMQIRAFSGPTTPAVELPIHIEAAQFSADGRSMYGMLETRELVRVDLQPVRTTSILAAGRLIIYGFSVTKDGGRVFIEGRENSKNRSRCGLFDYTPATGAIQHVLVKPCQSYSPSHDVRVSPDGTRVLWPSHDGLDLVDISSGATKPLGDLSRPEWSPDGRWIAAIQWSEKRLFVIDANDTSKRRELGRTIGQAWSPDSKSILIRRAHLLRCGLFVDIDPPESLEIVDIATGKRTFVDSSQCRIREGAIGWLDQTLLPR